MTGSEWWTSPSNESSLYNCTSSDRAKVLGMSLEVLPFQFFSAEEKEEIDRLVSLAEHNDLISNN